MLDRRSFLVRGTLATLTAGAMPRMAFARAATQKRFVFIIQRGAADGIGTVMPVGDPAHAAVRQSFAEDASAGAKLDGMFTLHQGLSKAAQLYRQRQALFIHAVASPYRDRSHFDGQNVLETGGASAYQVRDGWMNRLLDLLPRDGARAIAVSATMPAALRGGNEVASYAPSVLPDASDDLLQRVTMLYQGDAQLYALWSEALSVRGLVGDQSEHAGRESAATGRLAAQLLLPADGARIAMIETGGWDTHSGQRARLAGGLKNLDSMLAALQLGLGAAWQETLVLVATEFGRTVTVNGTGGTDHGTGAAAMLFGGRVRGGRVIADWPGIAAAQLYEGRDLRPTARLDDVITGALSAHFGLDPDRVGTALFPALSGRAPTSGLVA
ncbi:DUF1501 domain-containing protein [Sphingomonas mucosissima]|uniref:DUF1501 domain-containing protein n=1 Tax=Sphingomonas mucosissima TaxID=370959 RepID=A0A245ZES0_9SPHN|nr:DUF1501 domain-containing protein [Sphingomonas mucosissima]OWK28244.1 hypothetical protein SPMU_31000 [Sphingomonas mucosissima]